VGFSFSKPPAPKYPQNEVRDGKIIENESGLYLGFDLRVYIFFEVVRSQVIS
jgi:hypothetical protein